MNSLQRYMDSIKSLGRITKEEEKALSRVIFYSRNPKNVKDAKEKMASSNLLLVVSRALKYAAIFGLKESDTMDIISEGNIGLVRAVDLYRDNRGASFATYAIYHIDQKISRYINLNKFLRVPEYYKGLRKKLDELEFRHKDKLTDKIIMKELDISCDVLSVLKDKRNRSVSFLEDMFKEEDGVSWADSIEDENALSPYQENCSKSLRDFLDTYMNLLNEREIQIIKCIHYSGKDMSLEDISKIVHVSRERVRQIYMASLRKLRAYMIRGIDATKAKEFKKPSHYGRRGTWRNTGKTIEEQEQCAIDIVNNLSIL